MVYAGTSEKSSSYALQLSSKEENRINQRFYLITTGKIIVGILISNKFNIVKF